MQLPSLDDLILTKQFGQWPRDLEDIRLLERCATAPAGDGDRRQCVARGVRTLLDRTLPADEFQRLLAIPLTDAERDDTRALRVLVHASLSHARRALRLHPPRAGAVVGQRASPALTYGAASCQVTTPLERRWPDRVPPGVQ